MISKEMRMLWSQIRRAWTSFSTNRRALLDESVIKVPKLKKDGTESKVLVNHWKCAECGELVTERDVDHRDPVGAQPRTDEEVAAACARLFCGRGNLRILCKRCHKAKSAKEKSKRR
jgi:5-methylcytosine-specific restriction endonuclease McrA